MKQLCLLVFPIALTATLATTLRATDIAHKVLIRDVTMVEGVRDNSLIGYGLVVGLKGTGDKQQTYFTVQTLASVLARMGVQIPSTVLQSTVQVKNVAAVFVTASLPMQVVGPRALQHQLLASRRAPPPRRHGNRQLPAQISPGQRGRIGFNLCQHAFRKQFSAELARTRSQIEQMIGRAQNIGVVLHNQNRVPQVAQLFKNMNQPRRVAFVCAAR